MTGSTCRLLFAVAVLVSVPLPGTHAADDPSDLEDVRQHLEEGRLEDAQAAVRRLASQGNFQAQETLASMLLRGVGSAPDREGAMGWLCLRVHDPKGGRAVTQALWLLAEYFRTGGGLPGRRYNDGDRSREDPVKAFFWFNVMAGQKRYFQEDVAEAAKLGRLGVSTLVKQLTLGEQQTTKRLLETWSPDQIPVSPERCLQIPRS